ncbi:type I restriction enzyme S subunit [Methanomicrobium sp. W14]|uniref:restriction endonuclease subunit S n=1 Tax=Methanomicrobium sp. W14 TaxID=2817839 RepID=UPI001AE70131|nr:restriction endonuclease subunit S [Methanomicrobium sp. W14]MBP2134518.1 type I restriction enzyme S subunit [Methanomicrobium sp. W14]
MGKRKPALRFKGFEEDWDTFRLEDLVQIIMGQSPDGSTYSETPSDYILVQGNADLKNGWVTPRIWTTQVTKKASAGDLIMSVRAPAGTIGKTAYDVVLGRGVAAIKGNEFLYQNLVKMESDGYWRKLFSGSTFESLNSNDINNAELFVSSNTEQMRIGNFFNQLDTLITQQQRKYDSLLNVKKSMLEKMFPKDGADVPEIRFKGFSGAWEQSQFGDMVDSYQDPIPTPHNGYTRLGIRSHAKGTFHSYVERGRELETAQMHRVAAGNFIVNITFGWEHAVAITEENDAGKLVSHRFPQFRFRDGLNPEFFKYVIIDEKFRHHLWLASPGGAGRNRVLKINEMLEYKMVFPSEDEQGKIANYFKNLDSLITLHHQKLDHLKHIKSALLEKMFVPEAA